MSLAEAPAPEPPRRGFAPGNRAAVGNVGNRDQIKRKKLLTTALFAELEKVASIGTTDTKLERLVTALVKEATGCTQKTKELDATGKLVEVERVVPPAPWAVQLIFERMEGKVADKLQVDDPGGLLARAPSFQVMIVGSRGDAQRVLADREAGRVIDGTVVATPGQAVPAEVR